MLKLTWRLTVISRSLSDVGLLVVVVFVYLTVADRLKSASYMVVMRPVVIAPAHRCVDLMA